MGELLPVFADPEEVVTAILSPMGIRTVKAINQEQDPPLILVNHIGGHSDYVTDFPQMLVETIDRQRTVAVSMAKQAQALIEGAFRTMVTLKDGTRVLIDGTQVLTSGHPEPFESNSDWRSEPALYELRLRRPSVYANL